MTREEWDKKVDAFLTEVDLRCKLGVLDSIILKYEGVAQIAIPRPPEYVPGQVAKPRLFAILTTGLEYDSVTTTFLDQYVAYLSSMIWFISPVDVSFVAKRLRRDITELKDELYLSTTTDGIHG